MAEPILNFVIGADKTIVSLDPPLDLSLAAFDTAIWPRSPSEVTLFVPRSLRITVNFLQRMRSGFKIEWCWVNSDFAWAVELPKHVVVSDPTS